LAKETIIGLQTEFRNYNTLKTTAKQQQYNFIEYLAEIKALDSNIKKESQLKKLLLTLTQRDTSCNMKKVLGNYRQGVTATEEPSFNGDW
jgi:hypothetical protein